MTDRQGIEIDYCPDCRGVWLDRGELDKIIERASNDVPASSASQTRSTRRDDSDEIERTASMKSPKKKKMSGLLGDLFEF
jgi:Zn-finger nucleic acid-binding protein